MSHAGEERQQSELLAFLQQVADIGLAGGVDQGYVAIGDDVHTIGYFSGSKEDIPAVVFLQVHDISYPFQLAARQTAEDLDIGNVVDQMLARCCGSEIDQLRHLFYTLAPQSVQP